MIILRCFGLLAPLALVLAGCATPESTGGVMDWNRPVRPMTMPPVFNHDMAIANPPYPRPAYADYLDEPTRFAFHPRKVAIAPADAVAEQTQEDGQTQENGPALPYLENGVLYVDPNESE